MVTWHNKIHLHVTMVPFPRGAALHTKGKCGEKKQPTSEQTLTDGNLVSNILFSLSLKHGHEFAGGAGG